MRQSFWRSSGAEVSITRGLFEDVAEGEAFDNGGGVGLADDLKDGVVEASAML